MLVSQKNTDPDLGTTSCQGEKHVTSPAMTETDSPLHGAESSSTTWMPTCFGPGSTQAAALDLGPKTQYELIIHSQRMLHE